MSETPTSRRLATILFADVVGYSRLMRADEERTLRDLGAHFNELVVPLVARFAGRVVKTVGDGVLVEFGSAVEAVRAAVELQAGMAARNRDVPAEQRLTFRVGLHLGDIIVAGDDVFGDTVNVAARLEGLAEPGGIVLSAGVHDQVRDKLDLPFRSLGARAVKNIDRPVEIWTLDADGGAAASARASRPTGRSRALFLAAAAAAVLVAGGGVAWWYGRSAPISPTTAPSSSASSSSASSSAAGAVPRAPAEAASLSVAVLLFANQSGDASQDYFSDGLTEDITRALGRFRDLTVISYNAVLPLRNKVLPPAELGRALNARYLVSGSVRRMGSRVRVTVQLGDTATGTQLWSEQYDDELSDIFAVQDRIAKRVAGSLATSLQQIAQQQAMRKPTDDLAAYDMLLKARAMAGETTMPANRGAREMLEKVTQMAPGYADAYAKLADVLFQRASFGWSEFAEQDVEQAIRLAQKAIEMEPDNVLAHGVLARVYAAVRKYDLALAESDRALQINPSDAEAMLARAAVLLWTGRVDQSITAAETAMRLNASIGPEAAFNLGIAYLLAGRYDDAVRLLEQQRARYPAYTLLDLPLAAAYAELGRGAEAAEAVREAKLRNPWFEVTSFGSRFQDRDLQRRVETSLRKAGFD